MNAPIAGHNPVTKLLQMAAMCLILVAVSIHSVLAQPSLPTLPVQSDAQVRREWQKAMLKQGLPKKGCFNASYPDAAWTEVPCAVAPQIPYLPTHGTAPATVGNGTDFSAQVSGSTYISSAVGSFPRTTNVTSESDGGFSNKFSLQINSGFFATTACDSAGDPASCKGWQQFIYSTTSAAAFMQYWLLNYTSSTVTCPAGWNTYRSGCWKNSSAAAVPAQTITNLGNLDLTGQAVSAGNDTVTMSVSGTLYSTNGADSVLNLASGWQAAEFNIVGDGDGAEAVFNTGATIRVLTSIDDGTTNAPSCSPTGYTGETNSLTLGNSCCPTGGTSPGITFMQSTVGTLACPNIAIIPVFYRLLL